jgi:hypothetical protein
MCICFEVRTSKSEKCRDRMEEDEGQDLDTGDCTWKNLSHKMLFFAHNSTFYAVERNQFEVSHKI